jgi:hypothetical protein
LVEKGAIENTRGRATVFLWVEVIYLYEEKKTMVNSNVENDYTQYK